MRYTRLGNSGLDVSRVCLGCMNFGDETPGTHDWSLGEADTRPIIERALLGKGPSTPPSIKPREPWMEVSGVLSSWLTVEMNSFFIRSTRLRSVTSRAIA